MIDLAILGLVYLGIGLPITIFIKRGIPFTEATKGYEKFLGLAFMTILWPIVLCVLRPGDVR